MLLRHTKSDWSAGAVRDFDRPLAGRGRSDAPRMGRWLKKQKCIPEIILCSPALRARETVVAVNAKLDVENKNIIYEDSIYAASADALLRQIKKYNQHYNNIMMVGHNPGMDELLCFLCSVQPPVTANGKLMTPAAVAVLEFDNNESMCKPGAGDVLFLMRPKALPDVI